MKYEVVKRWVTGERAEIDEDAIKTQLEDLMREYMELSCQRRILVTEHLQPTKDYGSSGASIPTNDNKTGVSQRKSHIFSGNFTHRFGALKCHNTLLSLKRD